MYVTLFWDWNLADFLAFLACRLLAVSLLSWPDRAENAHSFFSWGALLLHAVQPHCAPLVEWGLSLLCLQRGLLHCIHVLNMWHYSIPSAIRRASSSHTYPIKRVRRCW